jgi:hypothetical protein
MRVEDLILVGVDDHVVEPPSSFDEVRHRLDPTSATGLSGR